MTGPAWSEWHTDDLYDAMLDRYAALSYRVAAEDELRRRGLATRDKDGRPVQPPATLDSRDDEGPPCPVCNGVTELVVATNWRDVSKCVRCATIVEVVR